MLIQALAKLKLSSVCLEVILARPDYLFTAVYLTEDGNNRKYQKWSMSIRHSYWDKWKRFYASTGSHLLISDPSCC